MIKAIVTDIEGTTSSLSFVKDVLFPYSRERMADFVRRHESDPAVRKLLDDARQEAGADLNDAQVIDQLIRWIDEDKKITPLKALQGMIWKEGYEKGHFQGHVYHDVVNRLKKWKTNGVRLYVFSSGSVSAQKLLFAHTAFGDLTPLFSDYFDTRIGSKKDQASYRSIAQEIGIKPEQILFLSDIKEELDAAKAAGMQALWLVRDGTVNTKAEHRQVSDFDSIEI